MKQLVLAEKPSVAREIARVLGCNIRKNGYIEGPDHVVTWALGHLVTLAQPSDYNDRYKRWSLTDLPILPAQLCRCVIEQTADQYRVVESLVKREDIECVVIATDAGREGELVARWILEMAQWTGPTRRLWISSQTDEAISQGFASLKDGSLFDNLYAASEARAAADWYVGMNVTRALTCRYDAKLSAGRVQTPTLALITSRQEEIENFTGTLYWTLRADFGLFSASWQDAEGSMRIASEELAAKIAEEVKGQEAVIISLTTQEHHEAPPLAYNLTQLQRDANEQLSFSAKKTLDILQRLYEEHKIVTYPRTDSHCITPDIVPTIPARLRSLDATPFGQVANLYEKEGYRIDMEHFVRESGVTDHHAIIPTEQPVLYSRLLPDERAVWQLIAMRFLEALSQDYEYRTTTIEVAVADHRFVAHTLIPVRQGWTDIARIIGKRHDGEESWQEQVQSLAQGDKLSVVSVHLRRAVTKPIEQYTEATLLAAMEHPGTFVEDASLKRHLSSPLGTSATRADIIEKLVQNQYIERQGKYLVPTPKGKEVVRLAPPELRSCELTARWESRLAAIAEGLESHLDFIEDIKKNTALLVGQIASSTLRFSPIFFGGKTCPYCKGPMMRFVDGEDTVHYACQRLSCSYEEALVKKKHAHTIPVPKKSLVKTQSLSGSPKKVIVVKHAVKEASSQKEEETSLTVVRPSKLARNHGGKSDLTSCTEGATVAELIAASQRRRRERDKSHKQ